MPKTAISMDSHSKPRRGRPPKSNAEDTRERLMRAAAAQFSSAEFSDVNMSNIAAEAGLTGAAIYNHFASKEALFIATVVHMTRTNLMAVTHAVDKADGWRSGLCAVLALFAHNTTGWFRYPLLTSATQLKMLRNRGEYGELLSLRREFVAQFERLVAQAIQEGDFAADLPKTVASEVLLGFVFNGVGAVMANNHNDEEIRQIVDTAAVLLANEERR